MYILHPNLILYVHICMYKHAYESAVHGYVHSSQTTYVHRELHTYVLYIRLKLPYLFQSTYSYPLKKAVTNIMLCTYLSLFKSYSNFLHQTYHDMMHIHYIQQSVLYIEFCCHKEIHDTHNMVSLCTYVCKHIIS